MLAAVRPSGLWSRAQGSCWRPWCASCGVTAGTGVVDSGGVAAGTGWVDSCGVAAGTGWVDSCKLTHACMAGLGPVWAPRGGAQHAPCVHARSGGVWCSTDALVNALNLFKGCYLSAGDGGSQGRPPAALGDQTVLAAPSMHNLIHHLPHHHHWCHWHHLDHPKTTHFPTTDHHTYLGARLLSTPA